MNVSDKIDAALDEVLKEAIASKKVSKILSLLVDEILKLCEKNISVREQCEVINRAFKLDIKESAYSAFYYRNIKPLLGQKKDEFVKNSTPQNRKKTSISSNEMKQKKEVKKVAPREPIKDTVTIDNFENYQVTKSTKYDKYLNKGKK